MNIYPNLSSQIPPQSKKYINKLEQHAIKQIDPVVSTESYCNEVFINAGLRSSHPWIIKVAIKIPQWREFASEIQSEKAMELQIGLDA